MAIFKCKMCGGTIEFNPGDTVGVCDSCGTKQTLPRLDDDRRSNLYDRANHFRRNNEFDKASGIYEQILNEDTSDAEAYWSLVLCRYGIEYVEDPATHKRVPTVNRAQFTSIFDDDNYKSAINYADAYQRTIYEEEAGAINEIQKGILAISQKEEPFDVFICYKETDANGRRTQDSVLANDLYHQLTNEGFKVFFSRITLEDKLGTAYEPYIFAALNSAKVMVVLGTKPEHFNAVWVKNEWSRYLALVKQSSGKKVLIPAYRDMDPYDLPEEFSHLQAQDMSKLGFMQDLIRGIKKIARADDPQTTVNETVVVHTENANIAPLLKRAFMFLEDGEWRKADDFCEQVLNQDPENAQAYLGKLMAELNVRHQDDLNNCEQPFDDSSNYEKAVRFGDERIRGILAGYIDHINERNENTRLTGIYNEAVSAMNAAKTEAMFRAAAETFKTIFGFKDADALAEQCLEKAEECRKDSIYASAQKHMSLNTIDGCNEAIESFKSISGWKDADELVRACQKKIEEIKIEREKAAKKFKRIATIVTPIIVVCVASVILLTKVIIPTNKYNAAVDLYNAGKYEEAISAFEELNGYKDSSNQIEKCQIGIKDDKYNEAIDLIDEGNIINAYESLLELNGYKDSVERAKEIQFQYYVVKLKQASVGDIVCFGSYEQDNNRANGTEDIEWRVLDRVDDRILVISRYALDCQAYNDSVSSITWETCSLRQWLNGTFLNTAFSESERTMIPSVTVSADKNPNWNTGPGNSTTDQVFLLSITEVKKYFSTNSARQCQGTAYCYEQGAYESNNGNCWWWLRTPGFYSDSAAYVRLGGDILSDGRNVSNSDGAVRPAMWIDLGL